MSAPVVVAADMEHIQGNIHWVPRSTNTQTSERLSQFMASLRAKRRYLKCAMDPVPESVEDTLLYLLRLADEVHDLPIERAVGKLSIHFLGKHGFVVSISECPPEGGFGSMCRTNDFLVFQFQLGCRIYTLGCSAF